MNVQEYISSGAIEACVMGLADEQDWLELDQMSALYPEVKEYKDVLEKEQEHMHLAGGLTPPPALKDRIFSAISFNENENKHTIEAPVVNISEPKPAKPLTVPMMPTPKPMKWLQRAIAACVILLMGSIILNFYFYSQSVSYRKEYTTLLVQQNSIMARNKAMEASFNTLKNPDLKPVVMDGSAAKKPGVMATIYWDKNTKDVYLMVNSLPKAAPEKQYQLWAIVNGKPVDAGMVQESDTSGNMLLKMHNMPEAEAFAITLEKKGGSPTPTMDAMYVFGKV